MKEKFEDLISGFLENRVGLTDDFLSPELIGNLKNNLIALLAADKLRLAGIGSGDNLTKNVSIRKDRIFWLDRKNNDVHENTFFDFMDSFVVYLNRSCYTGITGYEFHYALYESGSFYKRHLDEFQNGSKRAFSMIMYLNKDWKDENGGQLCIYMGDKTLTISPESGRCAFFKSDELEHEVLLSHRSRGSVTGWLRRD